MLTDTQATAALQAELPGLEIAAHALYNNLHLFRVVFPSESEGDFDPFFSVDSDTGEVQEFSVLTDGDISEVVAAFASQTPGKEA